MVEIERLALSQILGIITKNSLQPFEKFLENLYIIWCFLLGVLVFLLIGK